jgi:hypothetical protein
MEFQRFGILGAFAIAFGFCAQSTAASLDTYTGIVAGAGNGSMAGGCTSFGPPTELRSFFTFAGPSVPTGGIASCGYVGGIDHLSSAGGQLTGSKSLGPVLLGNPANGVTYTGAADSVATYGSLGASASGTFAGGLPSDSQLALFEGAGAAKFSDTLTATSPLVASASAGFVRYQFNVHGSMSILGAQKAYYFGETYMVLDLQQQSGPVYEILNSHARRGSVGTISNGPPPAGWTAGVGTLSGQSTFYSQMLPMNWGQAWDVKVGLLAWAYGEAASSFLGTAKLTGIDLFDANGVKVTQFDLVSASGTNYLQPVPEPATQALMLSGLLGLAATVRRMRAHRKLPAPTSSRRGGRVAT